MLVLSCIISILIGPFYFVYKPPKFIISYLQYKWPDVIWQISTSSKVVALTIDDAPSEYTNEIMQILKSNDANATFFVIGSQVEGRQAALRDLLRNGNELGNHAMHDEPSRALSDTDLVEQIQSVEQKIHQIYTSEDVALPPKYFRPGSGFFSERMQNLLSSLDYRLVLGSIYPHDPFVPYWRVNSGHILSMLRPGAIIICHDRRSWTAPMLRKVLPEIRRRGYRIVTVTDLLREIRS